MILPVVYGVLAGGTVWLTLMAIKHWRWTPPADEDTFYGDDS